MKKKSSLTIKTSWGDICVQAESVRVVSCTLPILLIKPKQPFVIRSSKIAALDHDHKKILKQADAFVRGLFSGKKVSPPSMQMPATTPFIEQCWKILCRLPVGKTISYSELAEKAGRPRAARAAGSACGSNEIPLFIPCHRIIGSDGSLGGFSCGLPWKVLLLESERNAG